MGIIDRPDIHIDSAISFDVLIILHEHFNILGQLDLPSSGEASQFLAQNILRLWSVPLTTRTLLSRQQVDRNYLLPIDDSHMDSYDALTR